MARPKPGQVRVTDQTRRLLWRRRRRRQAVVSGDGNGGMRRATGQEKRRLPRGAVTQARADRHTGMCSADYTLRCSFTARSSRHPRKRRVWAVPAVVVASSGEARRRVGVGAVRLVTRDILPAAGAGAGTGTLTPAHSLLLDLQI